MKANIYMSTDKINCLYYTYVKYEIDDMIYETVAYGKSKRIAEARALSRLGGFFEGEIQ